LKNDPTAKLVIVGYSEREEPKAAKSASTRADLAEELSRRKGNDRGAHFDALLASVQGKGQDGHPARGLRDCSGKAHY